MTKVINENPILEFLKYGPMVLLHPLDKSHFIKLSEQFPDLQMERENDGKITIMSPVKFGSSKRESIIGFHVQLWNYHHHLGEVLSSSGGIELPDTSIKSPDVAWISDERLKDLPTDGDDKFLQAIPDFVAEIRSHTDRIKPLKKKMLEVWMKHGVRLAWLIDPYQERVWIYREGENEPELIEGFEDKVLTGEKIMEGMTLPLNEMRIK